jgi:hypothetical protein
MLQRLFHAGLVKGKTVGIDATTLEANAALRSIVRRETGESYQNFLTKPPPTDQRLHRPFSSAHYWFNFAIWQDAVDIEVAGADHEVDMHAAAVASCRFEIVVAHLVSALQRGFKRLASRHVACEK